VESYRQALLKLPFVNGAEVDYFNKVPENPVSFQLSLSFVQGGEQGEEEEHGQD